MELIIVRGLPGSGKSTYAKKLLKQSDNMAWHEADHYFEDDQGNYNYDFNRIADAHNQCYANVVKDLIAGKDVVVSNTFTRLWEISPYFALIAIKGVNVKVVELTQQYGSVHVDNDIINKMAARWETLPEQYNVTKM